MRPTIVERTSRTIHFLPLPSPFPDTEDIKLRILLGRPARLSESFKSTPSLRETVATSSGITFEFTLRAASLP
jgi:hypothetical protein